MKNYIKDGDEFDRLLTLDGVVHNHDSMTKMNKNDVKHSLSTLRYTSPNNPQKQIIVLN